MMTFCKVLKVLVMPHADIDFSALERQLPLLVDVAKIGGVRAHGYISSKC